MQSALRLALLILILPSLTFSASLIGEIQTEEDLIELLEEEQITLATYKDLSNLLIDKVDLNKDELTRLQLIPEIEKEDVLRIIKHRPFKSVEDLLKVPEIDNDKFLRLKPFVSVSSPLPLRAELGSKISETLGDEDSAKISHKLSLKVGKNISFCLKAEKEPEEDYEISYWRFKASRLGRIKEGIAGDFKPHFGEGLVLGDWLRGALITFRTPSNFEPTIIYSGLNSEELIGANIDFKGAGLTYYKTDKDAEVYGFHFCTLYKDLNLSAEMAQVKGEGRGLFLELRKRTKDFDLASSYRKYEEDFDNPYSKGFADVDGEDNDKDEEGVYFNLTYRIGNHWQTLGYFNQWKHPSNLVTDQKMGLKVKYEQKRVILRISSELENEDINREEGEKLKASVELKNFFNPKLSTTLYSRLTRKDVSSKEEKQNDLLLKVGANYKLTSLLQIETEAKYNDTDISQRGQAYLKSYLQLKGKLSPHLSLIFRYTLTNYSRDYNPPNPKQQFKLEATVKW